MRSDAVDSPDDPLEQDAPDYPADDPAIASWFLAEAIGPIRLLISGPGASTSTAAKTTSRICCIRKRPSRRSDGRPNCSPHGTKAAGLDRDPRAVAAASALQPHNRGTAMGNPAVPDGLRPGRPPLAGPLPRPALTREGSSLRACWPAAGGPSPQREDHLDRPLERRPRLGDAQVQRVVALLRKQPVSVDHDHRVVVLHRDLDVGEAVLLDVGPGAVREDSAGPEPSSAERNGTAD